MSSSGATPLLDRRTLVRSAILLVGGSVIGVPAELFAKSAGAPRFFTRSHYALLEVVADTIIPRTDTPGARDADVPAALDALMLSWASKERQAQFRLLLDDIDRAAVVQEGRSLLALTGDRRLAAVAAYDKAQFFGNVAYRKFKELVLTLFYLSEPGATQELRYEHTPGAWEPSIKVTAETRAWAV